MKRRTVQNFINLETMAGGALAEKINQAMEEVARNIQNPNTNPMTKREITVKIKFSPNKSRNVSNTSIAVSTKLAPTEEIDTQISMGIDLRTGELQIAEWGGVIPGQMTMEEYQEDRKAAAEEDRKDPDPDVNEETGEILERRKPIDLRERARERAEANA